MSSAAGTELARQLFARELRGDRSVGSAVAAAGRVTVQLMGGLSRWFGPYGSQALLTRAIASVQPRHPALSGVTMSESYRLRGLAESGSEYDAHAVIEAVVAMIASLAELLGRLIGDDLAIALLEQTTTASATGDAVAPAASRSDTVTKGFTTP